MLFKFLRFMVVTFVMYIIFLHLLCEFNPTEKSQERLEEIRDIAFLSVFPLVLFLAILLITLIYGTLFRNISVRRIFMFRLKSEYLVPTCASLLFSCYLFFS